MAINNIVLMKVMMELENVISRANASVFQFSARTYCADLKAMLEGVRAGDSVEDIIRNTGYDNLNGLQTLTLAGWGPCDESEVRVVQDNDPELVSAITEMAEFTLADHPIEVSKVVVMKAYVEKACVHHYVEIDFNFSLEKLKKFLK